MQNQRGKMSLGNALTIWQKSLPTAMNITYLQTFFRSRGMNSVYLSKTPKESIWSANTFCNHAHVYNILGTQNQ